ncbi:rRNA maturation RNase YbeY [Bacteroidota bacterium]
MTSVDFVSEQISFECEKQAALSEWIADVCSKEKKQLGLVTYIFCSDEYLLNVNKQYLNHDYYTDVITFDYSEDDILSGDIFISIDRVKDNAQVADIQFVDELHRIMIHGVLHLAGYHDKKPDEKAQMTHLEDIYLSLRSFK